MTDLTVLDEHDDYHYKDLREMINSPEYKRIIQLIRKGVEAGTTIVYPPLPLEDTNKETS